MGVLIVVSSALLLVLAAAQVSLSPTTEVIARPMDLRQLLSQTSMQAQRAGALDTISTTWEVVTDHSLQFIVSLANQSASTSKDSSDASIDPFSKEHRDPLLVVSPIAPMHTLLLNKFNTIAQHALLVTDSFRQQSVLTVEDMDAFFFCVQETRALGFYNSALEAGASQPHRHMQLIPLESLYTLQAPPLLFLLASAEYASVKPFSPLLRGSTGVKQAVFHLSEFHFTHAVVRLLPPVDWDASARNAQHTAQNVMNSLYYADYLFTAYITLLDACGIERNTASSNKHNVPHNMLLTEQHMIVVPRTTRTYKELVDVNALGYAGMLLARTPQALTLIKKDGPLAVIEGVASSV
jgi:ATP adenylyltransferase